MVCGDVYNDASRHRVAEKEPVRAWHHSGIRVEALDPAHWKVTGDLTIHGVTRPVVMDTGGAYHGERVQISLAILAIRND